MNKIITVLIESNKDVIAFRNKLRKLVKKKYPVLDMLADDIKSNTIMYFTLDKKNKWSYTYSTKEKNVLTIKQFKELEND